MYKRQAARGITRLQNSGIHVSGVVVSQVNLKKLAGYGGDMDYQGYYDYYGYSDAKVQSVPATEDTGNEAQAARV